MQVIPARVEIGQSEVAGLIARVDLIWRARAVRRRRTMTIHGDGDGDNSTGHHVAKLRSCSAVDRTGGQMKQQVDDARRLFATEQVWIERLHARTKCGERR